MNAYSEDLRKKIVEAKEREMPTTEVARAFGVGLSSVKRYVKTAREGGSLRPKSSPGRRPKADESARTLLESDLEERPAATLAQRCQYLWSVAGLRVSESTVSRLLRRLGWTRKKDRWVRANATGGFKGRLAGAHRRADRRRAVCVCRGDGFEHLAFLPLRLGAQGRASALLGATQPR
jgi:transposase